MGQSTSGCVASFAPLLTSMELSDDDDKNSERVAELQAAAEPGAKKKRASSSKKALARQSTAGVSDRL